jgi:hypothetical protein
VVVQGAGGEIASRPDVVGADIAYSKPAPSRWVDVGAAPWHRRPAFLAAQLVPPFVLALVFLAVRRREELDRNVQLARRQMAPRAARAAIAKARAALSRGDAREFVEALWEATAAYFGNRLNLPPGQVEKAVVLEALRRGGLDVGSRSDLESLFDRCDQIRFGGADRPEPAEMEKMVEQLSAILRACEKVKMR